MPQSCAHSVKLIHTRDLASLERMPRYQDHAGITLDEYQAGRAALQEIRAKHRETLDTRRWVREHDSRTLVDCGRVEFPVPRSLFPRQVTVPIPSSTFAEAVPSSDDGSCRDGLLTTRSNWFARTAVVRYRCPSDIFHRDGLAERATKLAALSTEERAELSRIDASPFRAPLLFISHRWRSIAHPDPDGIDLARLASLGDAFLIYDYSSFPQDPLSADLAAKLRGILSDMGNLLRNVVVLGHPDYLQRGWCVYEYLAACLKGSLVCDEIADDRFKELHRWKHTPPPPAFNPFHDGHEAHMENYIQEATLNAVNGLLPVFQVADYTVASDRALVRTMLRDLLKRGLPNKRTHNPYVGESQGSSWTDQELAEAFESRLTWEPLETTRIDAFSVDVPDHLQQAAAQKFSVRIEPSSDYRFAREISPFGRLASALRRLFREDTFGPIDD